MDRPADEASPELEGYARTPVVPRLVAHGKAAARIGSVDGACRHALSRIRSSGGPVLIGPGMTMRRIKQALGFDGTLLGVDAVVGGRPSGLDLSAAEILELLDAFGADTTGARTRPLLVVGVIGGQGFLFGRGNQQLSADVLKRIDRERILVVSSIEKLVALPERRLYVDTGDDAVDASFAGYLPVVVGERQTVQVAVGAPGSNAPRGARPASTGPLSAAVNDG